MNDMCKWRYVETYLAEYWATDCGNEHQFIDGGPAYNGYRFCPYCQKEIKEVKHEPVVHDNEHL
jgi:hypothetical protein